MYTPIDFSTFCGIVAVVSVGAFAVCFFVRLLTNHFAEPPKPGIRVKSSNNSKTFRRTSHLDPHAYEPAWETSYLRHPAGTGASVCCFRLLRSR